MDDFNKGDAAIGELPQASYIDDTDKFPMEQGGSAMYVTGELIRSFIDRNILGVEVETLPAGSDVTGRYNPETGILRLGIPRSLGAVNSVDGVSAGTNGDVPLRAVSFDRSQSLSDAQKSRARANLGLSPAAVAPLPLSVASGGLGTTTRAEAQQKIISAQYIEGTAKSINDIANQGIYIIYIPSKSDDATYLGWSGYALVEVLGISEAGYSPRSIQRITQMSTGRTSVRYSISENGWSYEVVMACRNFAVTVSAGTSQKIALAPFRSYMITTYGHAWIVSAGADQAAPLITDLSAPTAPSSLSCTAEPDCAVMIASSAYSYGFYITQI